METSQGYKFSYVFIEVVLLCSIFLKCGTFIEVRQMKVKYKIKMNFFLFLFSF
jgi:hypothetical protein